MTKPVLAEVPKVEPVADYRETLKLAAYAAQNGGKTLQIRSLIREYGAENVGIISCEHGLRTIESSIDQRYVFKAAGLDDLRAGWAWANERFSGPDKWVCVDGGSRALYWINHDIFNGAQQALEGVIEGTQKKDLDAACRKYATYITKDQDLNTQQMWWRTGYECERLLDSFIRIGSNMYWTFWEDQTSISQFVKGVPWIPETPGKGALMAVKGAFDFIFRLTRGSDEKIVATFRNPPGNAANYTKTRDDWDAVRVPDNIADFNLGRFTKLIRNDDKEKQTA